MVVYWLWLVCCCLCFCVLMLGLAWYLLLDVLFYRCGGLVEFVVQCCIWIRGLGLQFGFAVGCLNGLWGLLWVLVCLKLAIWVC